MSQFTGFPKAGLRFLKELEANNNREWFEAHKQDYLDTVRDPAVAFVGALGERLKSISGDIVYDTRTNGSGSLLRIHRDVRFSRDKAPYKTNIGIIFWEGSAKKIENPGFYFHLDSSSAWLHGGLHMFPKPFLDIYREALGDKKLGSKLEAALEAVKSAGEYQVGGEQYKRVPQGYDKDHPRADLLRYKGLGASTRPLNRSLLSKPELVDVCFEHCQNIAPLQQWFVRVIQGAR